MLKAIAAAVDALALESIGTTAAQLSPAPIHGVVAAHSIHSMRQQPVGLNRLPRPKLTHLQLFYPRRNHSAPME